MALSILDGNQSATTLSTIVTSGQHIPAHTVVSLGTQAKTDILSAISSGIVISGSVDVTSQSILDGLNTYAANYNDSIPVNSNITYIPPITGEVTANVPYVNNLPTSQTQAIPVVLITDEGKSVFDVNQSIKATINAGTNRIGVVTIGGGTVTIGAGTAQIGAVTASISNSVVTFYPMQGTSVSNTNFTSTTASTTLVSAVAGREVLTVFNEGAGNLHISPGATCTTIAYQVRLSTGDYWECPAGQTSLLHTAVFASAGTARVTQVS
jgi:hypothetical protein